ncbi:MAG: hypothetical protein OXG05_07095 [Gammaproteobacteria bacterium]|nr:hypothetical protein [Gammaproteobacteria bacterium]
MAVYERTRRQFTNVFLGGLVLVLSGFSISEEERTPPPIRVDAMFAMMSNQMVDVVCDAPEFRACFDVPHAECSRELRKMLADCRMDMSEELPELIRADEVDPILERVYGCVIPKWDTLIEDRRTETEECRRVERQVEKEETP